MIEILKLYVQNRIELHQLIEYVSNETYSILKNDSIFEIESLKKYPILVEIEAAKETNKLSKQKAKRLISILEGDSFYTYRMWAKLQKPHINNDELIKINQICQKYEEYGYLNIRDIYNIKTYLPPINKYTNNIKDWIVDDMISLIESLPISESLIYNYNSIFVQENDLNNKTIANKIYSFLDILTGRKPFYLTLKYLDNSFSVSMQV